MDTRDFQMLIRLIRNTMINLIMMYILTKLLWHY